MTADEVQAIVDGELAGDYSITNLHGVDLTTSLTRPPRLIELTDVVTGKMLPVWLVLEAHPEGPGYIVVYSPEDREFGLGQVADGYEPALLGLYGSFIDTFKAM